MALSWKQTGARLLVTKFFKQFIATGCLILLEDNGTILTFEGTTKKSTRLEVSLRVHNPDFYWKIATRADLGLADAYIDGDFSLVDKNYGLVTLFMILIANSPDLNDSNTRSKTISWWTPLLVSIGFASAISSTFRLVLRQNTLTQARRNISCHYDLSNEFFSLFLDESMSYSCGIFEREGEDLKDAQHRKISLLIEKAKISKEHHILEIGFGWGNLAIEIVKRTGCKYTGITLSIQQLKYAEEKVKEADLQTHIQFLLCDYRQLPETSKYDRIISCEMIEHVGHQYVEEFFKCCDSVLEEDGLLVLQFTSIQDDKYDKNRKSPGFITEYIFPGSCILSLTRVITAMAAGSRLRVENLETIGSHYYQTLRCWRDNFMKNQSLILELGFDEKFIRTWEYYFEYCAAGFKSPTLGNYQIVFSRSTDVALSGNPFV